MKVSDLQQHLADLARLIEASGGKTIAADLVAIRAGLEPFREHALKTFADFLVRADAFDRGIVPVEAPKKARAASTKKASTPNVEELTLRVIDLYDRAADPAVTTEQIDALAAQLKKLDKTALVSIAEAMELKGMKSKKKDDIVQAIQGMITERRGAAQRVALTHRELATEEEHPPTAGGGSLPPLLSGDQTANVPATAGV